MKYFERLQKLNREYADAHMFNNNEEIDRICELALDLCEEMIMIPESKWIPCSERFPENCQECNLTIQTPDGKIRSTVTTFYEDDVVEGKWHYGDYRGEETWWVIAWMPLPEPYKENIDQ